MQESDNSIIPGAPGDVVEANKVDAETQPALLVQEDADNDNIDPTTVWNIEEVEKDLKAAYETGLEIDLLKILKANSFLFYDLYKRKWRIHPVFAEVSFGGKYKADFVWLNDDSDGPEWVLIRPMKKWLDIKFGNDIPVGTRLIIS